MTRAPAAWHPERNRGSAYKITEILRLRCALLRMTRAKHSSLLNDFGVLDHRDAAAFGQFAFERDRFAAGIRQLVIHRLVFADHEIGLAVVNDSDRAAVLDAFGAARFSVLFADRVVIEITHHVD